MEEKTWNANKAKLETFFNTYPGSPKQASVEALFLVGDLDANEMESSWGAITMVMRGVPNSPIGRGRQADIDPEVDTPLKAMTTDDNSVVIQAYTTLYETITNHCGDSIIWGRGGNSYANAAEFAEHEAKTLYNALIRAYRAATREGGPKDSDRVAWTGNYNKKGQITGLTLHPKSSEDNAEESA
jgi:hypothetical protein